MARSTPLDIEISSLILEKPDGTMLKVLPAPGDPGSDEEGAERYSVLLQLPKVFLLVV